MNVTLWIVQGLLAAMFAAAGVIKLTVPKTALGDHMPWAEDFSSNTIKLIGGVELLAAIGLILPAWTGIAPVLTPLAATGLAVVMVLAIVTHARRNEPKEIVVNVAILAVAAFVAWGRFGPYSF